MTAHAPTKKWLMKAVEQEAACDISAGPVLPRVKVSSSARATNGHARKAATVSRPIRRALAKV